MKTFELEVITPEQTTYTGRVRSLTVPAEGGSIGILANHAALLSAVDIGDAKVIEENGHELHMLVSSGFLEVENNHARLLVEIAERGEDIDEARAREAEKRARERLEKRSEADFDLARAETALRRAMIRQRIIRDLGSTGTAPIQHPSGSSPTA